MVIRDNYEISDSESESDSENYEIFCEINTLRKHLNEINYFNMHFFWNYLSKLTSEPIFINTFKDYISNVRSSESVKLGDLMSSTNVLDHMANDPEKYSELIKYIKSM